MHADHYVNNWIGLSQAFIDCSKGQLSKLEYTRLYNRCLKLLKTNKLKPMHGNESPVVQRALYLSSQGEE